MSDIVERLRAWVHTVKAVPASDIMDEAADEIDRLRNGSLAACETVRLTDEEREAIGWAAKQMKYIRADNAAATLRALVERLK
jgi:hypothetical protein